MKVFIKVICAILFVALLSSCSWNLDDPDLQTAEPISGVDFLTQLEQGKNVVFEPSSHIMGHELLSIGNGVFHCRTINASHILYNPIIDQAHYMCFNPSCVHKRSECLTRRLMSTHFLTYYEGDLYGLYPHDLVEQASKSGIAKISSDGSSMELVCSMNPDRARAMKAGYGYIYVSKDDGLYRYEIATGELKTFSAVLNGFVITDRGLLTHCSKDGYVMLYDYDLSNGKPLFELSQFVYSGNKVYYARVEWEKFLKSRKYAEFYEYDLDTGENRYITKQEDYAGVFCYYDGYLYYGGLTVKGDAQLEESHRVYRMDVKTGEVESVFYDKDWYVDQLYCVNGQFYACMAKTSFGKMVDKDGDGMWEFEIFEWDKDGVTLGP